MRSQSVREALRASGDGDPVVVHDAARPLASAALFERALAELEASGADAVIAAVPVSDTIKQVGDGGTVARTLDRSRLWAVQTPQVFRRAALERVFEGAADELLAAATDDAWLIEQQGGVGAGDPGRRAELQDHDCDRPEAGRAASGWGSGVTVSTGLGYDCHRFAEGRRLVLGGVELDHDRGLAGHSDADVLTHAIIDALLGAAALGDIGEHFPDTDERYRDVDSLELLRTTVAMLSARGVSVVHVDATVVIERPHVAPVREQIRASLAGVIGISLEHVSVKATRGEGMGFVGRQEGAAALAVATVER